MKEPFACVLHIEHDNAEHLVSLYRSLDEAEDALRVFAATVFVGLGEDEIVESLAECGEHVRLYSCAMKRGKQISTEIQPFTRAAKAA